MVFFAFVIYPVCYGFYLGGQVDLYRQLFADPRYLTAVLNTAIYVGVGVNLKMFLAFLLSGFFMRKRWWIKSLLLVFILPWATPALPAYISIHWLMNGQWGMLNNILWLLFGIDGPVYLNDHWTGLAANIGAYIWKTMPFWTIILLAGRMSSPAGALRGSRGGWCHWSAPIRARDPAADGEPVHRVRTARYHLRPRRLQLDVFCLRWRASHVHGSSRHSRHPVCLHHRVAASWRRHRHDRLAGAHTTGLHTDAQAPDERGAVVSVTVAGTRRRQSKLHYRLHRYAVEGACMLLGFAIVIWSLTPIYNMVVIALDSHDDVFSGAIWPEHPSLGSFRVVVTQDFWYFAHFWHQFGNSFFVGLMTMFLTLAIGTLASFTVGRMHLRKGWMLTNAALMTYVIPASFLAIPLYRIMQIYGLTNSLWAVILSIVTFSTPYAIFIFSQYGKSIPMELDELARIDGANPLQIYFRIYLPLMAPALVAVGTYALLLAWNEYLYNFLMLSTPESMTVAVALAQFLNSDKSPWNFMMATAIIYALPPLILYYGFRRYMAAGLTMGGVKG